ncbi:uncharacterized protein BDV14DRAFT_143357 [Aspergillus stella-maris]|uniref:uncharacterized protein n=1 Tax=Aspergillus stella-maris TaxID=1810926 RepID=UPI003CCDD575
MMPGQPVALFCIGSAGKPVTVHTAIGRRGPVHQELLGAGPMSIASRDCITPSSARERETSSKRDFPQSLLRLHVLFSSIFAPFSPDFHPCLTLCVSPLMS